MSHKTLYIDIDEEITSIIDRVRKSQAGEIIVVAPKQALLLQSLVNLKLLKKEADRKKKKVMIVTQDKIGKKLIEKAGILVQKKMDESAENPDAPEERALINLGKKNQDLAEEIVSPEEELNIGSNLYFDEFLPEQAVPKEKYEEQQTQTAASSKERKIVSGKKTKTAPKTGSQVKMSDIVSKSGQKEKSEEKIRASRARPKEAPPSSPRTSGFFDATLSHEKTDQKTSQFFREPVFAARGMSRQEKILKTEKIKGKSSRYFFVFSVFFLFLAILAGVYFYLPRVTILIHPQSREKNISLSLEANASASGAENSSNIISAALEQVIREKTRDFEASGRKSGGGKATGNIVIYNEFSSESQPLVATTRFETSDGKIFRIAKSIIVPGISKIGTETKPGAIEVEVTADKPGEAYNIEPADFRIPGFKSGPKYDKFYAKSAKAMTGGAEGESPIVTSQDVTAAKEELLAEAKKEAVEELQKSLPPERKYFFDTIATEVVSSAPSMGVGTQTEKFSLTVKIRAKVLSFSEEDVKEIMKKSLSQEENSADRAKFEKPINYFLTESVPEKEILRFEAKTDLNLLSEINLENFKKGARGKNESELENLVKTYPSIQKMDVNFWPFFVTRVPMDEKRIKVEVK